MSLTREDFLSTDDITIKEITIPERIPAWGGKKIFIKQLTRAQQDAYLKRQNRDTQFKQERGTVITGMSLYGHDAWLCVQGCCDEGGKALFSEKDIDALNEKSGEVIGWIASQIVVWSRMGVDKRIAKGEITPEQGLAEELKN